jgi:class 3 adenylate cyclase/predicted ATPase
MDVGDWLGSLGLGQYLALFREHAIDAEVLPDLTDADLEKFGVPFGHRKRLIKAIAKLGAVAPEQAKAPLQSSATILPDASAERRHLTVMFVDLVGSTALSARLDPEDMREVIAAYHKCCANLIQTGGGFVAKFMGDGVLAYFGYPQAQEQDAENAVKAGLAIAEAAPTLDTVAGAPLHVRVGIATGIVVVGDLLGSGEAQERGVVGDTPNLAARLQEIAEPNMVVISSGTRRLLGNLFELHDLRAMDLKGIAEPVRPFAALRVRSVESRFEALHASGLTALVGREEEFELLLRRWSRAKSGEGQVVLLSGEPGIGKSRLTAALLEHLASEPLVRIRHFCSPQHADNALYPIICQMERATGFTRDDILKAKLDKLDILLAQSSTSAQDAALFAEMLSLPNDGRYPALELTPHQRRQRTLEALVLQIVALSRQNPLLMIFEDAHWTDPTSLELFGRVVDKISTLRVLLIVTFRPEFEPPWIGRAHVTHLTINRLEEREVCAIIDGVTGNKLLPANIRQDIFERTDGIPLFVEEMTKAVLEAEGEGAAERVIGVVPSPVRAVPASLHASLMARLDRLASAKEVAQIGAVIGREFPHALLAAVARMAEPELQSAVNRLVEAGLLFRQGLIPHATYLFKHALVQDAAYQSLLRSPRQQLHQRIGQALVERFPEIAETEPALIAQHYTEAGIGEQAIAFWLKAGQRAIERSANLEAIAHLTKGLEVLKTLPETSARDQQELVLQTTVGAPLIAVKGMAAPEVERAYTRARQLCLQVGDAPRLFPALFGLWWFYEVKPDLQAAYELAQQLLNLAERAGDSGHLIQGHRTMGHTLFWRGEFASARAHLEQAIALYDPQQHSSLAFTYGEQAGLPSRAFAAHALWYLGYPDQALKAMREVRSVAVELNHPWTVVMINVFAAWLHAYRREFHLVRQPAETALKLASEQQFAFFVGHATVLEAWARARLGDGEQAIADIRRGIAAYRATGAELESSYWFALLAEACATIGAVQEGLAALTEALNLVTTTGVPFCHAELFRLNGELLLKGEEPSQAEASFREAIHVASIQHAKLLELRASTSLAQLWRDQGKVQQARELLAPVYGWFTEGFDTRDLKEAKALLDQLPS